ncbi:hypothetical protein FHS27_002745 [Rhodopirellula rubra]|uniref:Uncharacterized protein n=1 Tax=Aporhodopirellula rubra TaxID=980271 RepID=A0A7W5H6K0_9BACT|nr:hypothetical protein [Aporhodopirellula rubra]
MTGLSEWSELGWYNSRHPLSYESAIVFADLNEGNASDCHTN